MLSIRLDKEIEKQLTMLACSRGSSRSALAREAILRYLEDQEDMESAEKAREKMTSTKALRELRKELELDG
jgi:RHH-type transcriptional regulator, rel operon repressor / antitoxin RelB